jgi:hypothetical protein
MMAREVGAKWNLRVLHSRTGEKNVSLPVFVRCNRWRRHDLTVQPVAYYVTPWEYDDVDTEVVCATLTAASSMRTSTFTWWLPPWSSWQPAMPDNHPFGRLVSQDQAETYLIEMRQSLEEHMANSVSKTQSWQARTSIKRGLEVVENLTPELVDEYYSLYLRVRKEEGWTDKPFSRLFFHDAATTLEEGGQLLVMKYENRIVGGGVLLFDRRAVHYFQGTTDRNIKTVFPHSVICAEALKRAAARGLKFVNLGGVNEGNTGLIQFKLAWGAAPRPVPIVRWRCSIAQALQGALRFPS